MKDVFNTELSVGDIVVFAYQGYSSGPITLKKGKVSELKGDRIYLKDAARQWVVPTKAMKVPE